MNLQNVKEKIINDGFRFTKTRSAIIEFFYITNQPITATEILKKLHSTHLPVNKTTVYRELQFLCEQKIIKSVQLKPNITSYEFVDQDHHHHIVCNNCGKVEDVILPSEKFLDDVKKQTSFQLQSHSLEFYGLCQMCN